MKYGGTMLGFRLSSLAVDALGAAGLPFESLGEAAEDDDATTWNIDYMYDVGLMIGGGSNNIQKNIIGERGLGLPREPKVHARGGCRDRQGLSHGFRPERRTAPVRRDVARLPGRTPAAGAAAGAGRGRHRLR